LVIRLQVFAAAAALGFGVLWLASFTFTGFMAWAAALPPNQQWLLRGGLPALTGVFALIGYFLRRRRDDDET
jgi:hypothetical protein